MSFFGDIKDKFSKDTYEGGYMYEDDGANGQYGYDETPETPDMPADNEATIGGSGYDIMGGGSSIELKVVKPQLFEDSAQVADHLLSKRTVVLNLEDTNKEAARLSHRRCLFYRRQHQEGRQQRLCCHALECGCQRGTDQAEGGCGKDRARSC